MVICNYLLIHGFIFGRAKPIIAYFNYYTQSAEFLDGNREKIGSGEYSFSEKISVFFKKSYIHSSF